MISVDRLCMGCMNDNGGEEICPICGHNVHDKNGVDFLPVKTWIKGRYLVGKMLESNGEGVTYIGWDNEDNNIVNIREFFPSPLAFRGEKGSVQIAEGKEYEFNSNLMDFLKLHRMLADVVLAAVAPVIEIIECNSTAYVVTKTAPGIPLREFLLRNGGALSWEQTRPLFLPLISQMISLHSKGIIHGGISPETIIVGRDGKLRLTGFSVPALRKAHSGVHTQLFPGYAAIEQYRDDGVLTESSDVYGFAATLFRVLMGSTLLEATERITDDKMAIPAKIAQTMPKTVLVTLADALQIMADARTKTMNDFKLDIAPAADMTSSFVAQKAPEQSAAAKPDAKAKKNGKKPMSAGKKYALLSAGITAGVFLLLALVLWLILDNPFAAKPTPDPEESVSTVVSENSQPVISSGEKLLSVPDFTSMNMTFEQICQDNADFKFQVLFKKYSSKAAGIVVGQDVPAGSQVARDTTISLTISLGGENISLPELTGMTKNDATLTLFKSGYLYNNIHFYEIEDDSVDYQCVVKTDPKADTPVSPDATITVYISNVKRPTTSMPNAEQ